MRRFSISAMLAAALGLVAALAIGAAPASAATPNNSVAITQQINGGTPSATLTATITNEMSLLPVQVVALAWPSNFTVTGASLPAGYPKPLVTSCKTGPTTSVPCVQVRGLGLKPKKSVVLTMTANAPAGCAPTMGTWHVNARSDLLFTLINVLLGGSGSLNLDPASQLQTSVADSCHLQFTQEPASANVGQTITGTAFTPSGPALTVGIFDQNNIAVPLNGVPVTAHLNATAGSLGGTAMQLTSNGVATFGDLSVSAAADNDSLTASTTVMPPIADATSTLFDVAGQGTTCAIDGCSVDTSTSTGSLMVSATGTTTGDPGTLQGSILSGSLACSGYQPGDLQPGVDPNVFEVLASSDAFSKTVVLSFMPVAGYGAPTVDRNDEDFYGPPDESPGQYDFDDVLWQSEICFQAPYQFATAGGGTAAYDASTGMYTGLLADCPSDLMTATDPCHDRASDRVTGIGMNDTLQYTINLHAYIPAGKTGDPRMN